MSDNKFKIRKIDRNSEFRRLYRRGKTFSSSCVAVYLLGGKESVMVGVTSSKKIGGAVQRNRARRVIRAAFRSVAGELKRPCKVIIVARSRATKEKSTVIEAELREIFRKAGLL